MKRILKVVFIVMAFIATTAAVYAITDKFLVKVQTSNLYKKDIFDFKLASDLNSMEVGPRDSFTLNPTIYNDATEEIYAFISLEMPRTADVFLYEYEVDEAWQEVEASENVIVYAYARNNEMTALAPGEETDPLTSQMAMINITNAEYASIDDINFTITGYAIGTDDVDTVPIEAWKVCKALME